MKSKLQKGFTLIELMIVVAIVGILAAIAIPAYSDYMVRAKVSEGVAAVDQMRSAVAEFYATSGHFPAAGASFGMTASNTVSGAKYISSVDYAQGSSSASGTLTAKFRGISSALTSGMGITYTGTGSTTSITWTCAAASSMPPKYLPANCR